MQKHSNFKTSLLFTKPNFLSGFGSAMGLAGNFYKFKTYESGFEADKNALENDFRMVGQDLFTALKEIKANQPLTEIEK